MEHVMGSKAIKLLLIVLFVVATGKSLMGAPKRSDPISVGMIALLAAPEKYKGKVIRTWGFLNLRSDDDGIFLHEEDLQIPLLKNSFKLELTSAQENEFKDLNHTYVLVQGTMHSDGADGPELNSGTISNITIVHGWKPYIPFQPVKK